jgi:hypothetical protein
MQYDKSDEATAPNEVRRRLFRGTAGGFGVLLAVQAKTALGTTTCISPSAKMSGNQSHPHDNSGCSGGRSPGFWKVPQKFSYWKNTTPATLPNVYECASGLGNLKYSDVPLADHGTSLNSIFPGATTDSRVGVWAVLAFPTNAVFGGTERGQLLRALAAAWLNANYFTSDIQSYPLTPDQVKEMWTDLNSNGVYCPGPTPTCTNGWNATTVRQYIEGMYDFNSSVEPDLCK